MASHAARLVLLLAVAATLAGHSGTPPLSPPSLPVSHISLPFFVRFSPFFSSVSPLLSCRALGVELRNNDRGRVVHLPPGAAGPDAAEDAGLRVRRRRRLPAHPAERRLLRPQQRQGALLLRRQQLLPAQRPEPAGLRLRRHRHGLRQRPKQQRLHLPRNPECFWVKRRRGRHHRRRGQPASIGSELLQRQQQRHQHLPGGGGWDSEAGGDPGLLLVPRPVPRRVIEETRHPCPSSQLRLGVLFPGTFLVLVVVAGRKEPFHDGILFG